MSGFSKGEIIVEENEDKIKSLPIFFPPPIKYSLHGAITLAIILANPNTYEWYINNFIQMCFDKNYCQSIGEHPIQIYPVHLTRSGKNAASLVLNDILLSSDIVTLDRSNIVDSMVKWIDKGFYISATVNVTKFPGTKYYQNPFRLHGCTCFGYDLKKNSFKIIDYNEKQILSIIEVSFDNYINAFFYSNEKNYVYQIALRRVKSNFKYTFDFAMMKRQLYEYLFSKDSGKRDVLLYSKDVEWVWGINVYSYFVPFVKMCIEKLGMIDIRPFCALQEHKCLMYERIRFLEQKGILKERHKLSEKYLEVMKLADILKMYILKNGKEIVSTYSTDFIKKQIIQIKRQEKRILIKVYFYCVVRT